MGSKRVHIRVGENRREKWKEHAAEDFEDKYGSVSKLIRDAVETQIDIDSGNLSAGGPTGETTVEPNGRIDDIKVTVEDNESTLEDIQERLTEMHDTMASQGAIPDRVYSAVYGAIPTVEFEEGKGKEPKELAEEFGAHAPEIAEEAGVSMVEASKVLIEHYHEYDDVEMLMLDQYDAPRYWRHQ